MGCGPSREELEHHIQTQAKQNEQDWQHEKTALAVLDAKTRVGHLLLELRNLGFVELQGKDIGGIYERLDEWLKRNWRAKRTTVDIVEAVGETDCGCEAVVGLSVDKLRPCNELCDASYCLGSMSVGGDGVPVPNGVYKACGDKGQNNMGKLTMQVVNFMTNECGWTLQVCDAGNNGFIGQIREQQVKFRAPHPLNLIAPHIMIELRAVGFIEINGPNTDGIHDKLHRWLNSCLCAYRVAADPGYCDVLYKCDQFLKRGSEGENNMGLLTMQVVDFMVKKCAWTMITCNGGNFGRKGDKREQQLVFRNDEHVQHGLNHIMIELRTSGYIELNGLADADDLRPRLDTFLKAQWGCTDYTPYFWEDPGVKYCDKKYACRDGLYYREGLTNNLGKLSIDLASFLGKHGWELLLANGGSISPNPQNRPNDIIREQQLKFAKARNKERAAAPLLMLELRTQPTHLTPIAYDGHIEINGPNTNGIHEKVGKFITQHMRGHCAGRQQYCNVKYDVGVFRLKDACTEPKRWDGRLNGESNIGKWTMRLCDFMVDHIGEWDMIACNSDNVDWTFHPGISVTGREMQLIFRHKPGGRAVFMAAPQAAVLGRPSLHPPRYWADASKQGTVAHKIVPGSPEELGWIQQLLDGTFKRKATRDRTEGLAERFVAVQCLRSEHPALWDKFAQYRMGTLERCKARGRDGYDLVAPKTIAASPQLAERCTYKGENPTCQAYLMHGTNPTSAVAILDTSFKVDFAGKTAGTMFGPGIYFSEASSKADEYARDDSGGEYDGLYAVILCRAVLGRPFVTQEPGNYAKHVTSGDYDVVVGDREAAVGTYREFIFFHEGAVYPEYAAFYRRESGGKSLPRKALPLPVSAPVVHRMAHVAPPPAATVGGTQRWQYAGDAGTWHDFALTVAVRLDKAQAAGEASMQFEVHGVSYTVNFAKMVQKRLDNGTERKVHIASGFAPGS